MKEVKLFDWVDKFVFSALFVIAMTSFSGCGSTVQPQVGAGGEVNDKTLNGNVVDFFTLIRVQNNYGTNIRVDDSDNAKVSQ